MNENVYTIDLQGIEIDDHKRESMKRALSGAVKSELPTVENFNCQIDGNIITVNLANHTQDGETVKVNSILLKTIAKELASIKVALIPIVDKWPEVPFPRGIKVIEMTDDRIRSMGG